VIGLTTEQLAVLGIAGTLLGAVVGAVVAPWASGRSERRLRLLDRRLDAYTELLEVSGRLYENALARAIHPLADTADLSEDRVRALDARIRVVGSRAVRKATERFAGLSSRFFAELWQAQIAQRKVPPEDADSGEAVKARMALGKIADEMKAAGADLEAAIQRELKG
jgi:hypothetical protein